ncbi:MAG: hypothetical protein ACRYG8_29125 [Janthinobacterium lividum]
MAEMRNTTPGTAQAVSDPLRRQLMGGAVLAALAGGGAVPSVASLSKLHGTSLAAEDMDAELIGLCARCDMLQDQVDALHVRPSDDMTIEAEIAWEQERDVLVQPICDRQEELFERICELRATTMQGHVARTKTLLGWDRDLCRPSDHHCWSEQLVIAVVRDLAASA